MTLFKESDFINKSMSFSSKDNKLFVLNYEIKNNNIS